MHRGSDGPTTPAAVQVVLFDAVGTLIHPRPAAVEIYYRVGRDHGSQATRRQVADRFGTALNADEMSDRGFEGATSPERERDRWREIVAGVFPDVPLAADAVFETLWRHFAQPRNWQLDPQVPRLCRRLAASGYRLAIASNFDERLESICRQLLPWAKSEFVFHSARIGVRKPGLDFFRQIEVQLDVPSDRLLLVGDDLFADYEGARAAGWQAIWLDRVGSGVADVRAITRLDQLVDHLPM